MTPAPRVGDAERHDIASALAANQYGVASRGQLIAAGMSSSAIGRRLADGRFRRLHASVYAIGHAQLRPEGFWTAGVLAGGAGTVLCHRSVAAAWGLRWPGPARVDVNVVGSAGRGQPGIASHSCQLDPDEITTLHGIPVTTVARTLLDLAEVVPRDQLRAAVVRAEELRLFDLSAIHATLQRAFGRRGTKPLRLVLDDLVGRPTGTRRELEARALDLIRAAGLPNPVVNTLVVGHEVDLLWRRERLVVELDSWRHHGTRRSFEDDRQRDVDLQLAGYRAVRFTWRQVTEHPARVAHQLRALLTTFGR